MGLCFSPLYAMLPVFSPRDGPHELWGNENKKSDGKLLRHECKCIFSLRLTHTHNGGRQIMTTWTCGDVCIFHQSKLLHIPTHIFLIFRSSNQLNCQREREREREREGALYPASRSMCSTFSGLYSSAVIQSVIFKKIKKGLFIESLLRCSYSVLRCLNHVFTAELVQ